MKPPTSLQSTDQRSRSSTPVSPNSRRQMVDTSRSPTRTSPQRHRHHRTTANGSDPGARSIYSRRQSQLSSGGSHRDMPIKRRSSDYDGSESGDSYQLSTTKKVRSHKNSISTSSDRGVISPILSPAASPPAADAGFSAIFPSIDNDTLPSAIISSEVSGVPGASAEPVTTAASVASTIKAAAELETPTNSEVPNKQQQDGHIEGPTFSVPQAPPTVGSNVKESPPQNSVTTAPDQPIVYTASSNRPSSQHKYGASTTTPIIRPHGSVSNHTPTSRGNRPSHLPNSASSTMVPSSARSSHSLSTATSEQPSHHAARQPLSQPGKEVDVVSGHAGHTGHTTIKPSTATNIPPPAASPPIIKPSSPAGMQRIMGRGNPPGRSAGIGGPGGGGAFSSPPPTMPFGGPPVAAQRPNPIPSGPSSQQSGNATIGSARYPGIELQPKTRPITHTQLVNEVKGIYVGLAMVESKCMEIDNEQSANIDPQNRLEDDQWQALLALHRTLLHEHHDFMLASQHPSASPALRRVAQKYAMPARMWRHGIHSFLELLRHRLPASREHMITFIYMAYSIIALLYETVRAFEDTWIECLGDLSRYRMAIEDDNFRTRDAWTVVSRRWYSLASDRAPTTGRLHHHLAILARPYVITQMYYYVKSLCVPIPFTSTRESIMTLLDPILNNATQHVPPVELAFIKAHAILFKFDLRPTPEFAPAVSLLLDNLDTHIALSARAWTQTGVYMAIVNSCAFLNYGGDDNVLMKVLGDAMNRSAAGLDEEVKTAEQGSPTSGDTAMTGMNNPWVPRPAEPLAGLRRKEGPIVAEPEILQALEPVQKLVTHIDQVVFSRIGDANCHGYIHARLVWMLCMARLPEGMVYVEHGFPWKELVLTLNNLMRTCDNYEKVEREVFMHPQVDKKAEEEKRIREIQLRQQQQQQAAAAAGDNSLFVPTEPPNVEIPPPPPARSDEDKPLPDDWFLRGLLWADYNFPEGWFANMESISDDERLMETASTRLTRKERVLWMACRLAALKIWMIYDPIEHRFEVTEAFGRVDDTKSLDDGDNAPDEDGQQKFKRDEVKADVSMSDTVGSETTGRDEDSDTADFDREEDEGGGVDLFSSMESIGNEQVSRFDPGRDWQPP